MDAYDVLGWMMLGCAMVAVVVMLVVVAVAALQDMARYHSKQDMARHHRPGFLLWDDQDG